MELIDLNVEQKESFYELITWDGIAALRSGDSVAIGLLIEDEPAGAIVADPGVDGEAEILSLYVKPEHRRKGYGTELVYQALTMLYSVDNMYRLVLSFTENEKEGAELREFLGFHDFELEEDKEHGSFSFTLEDAVSSKFLSGGDTKNVSSLSESKSSVKNSIYGKHRHLRHFIDNGAINENLSCIVPKEGTDKDPACLIIGEEDDHLVIAWAETSENGIELVYMLKHAVEKGMEEYGPYKKVVVPYINSFSKKIVEKILGDKAVSCEKVWNAALDLEWTMDEAL